MKKYSTPHVQSINPMKLMIKHCLTGKDNETYDVARVLLAIGTIAFIGLALYNGNHFDPQAYGLGLGGLLGGGGAGIGLKSKAEPE